MWNNNVKRKRGKKKGLQRWMVEENIKKILFPFQRHKIVYYPSSQAKAFYMKPNHMKFLKPPPPPHPLQPPLPLIPPPHPSSHHMLRDITGKRGNIFKATPPFPTFLVSSVQNPQLENRKTL